MPGVGLGLPELMQACASGRAQVFGVTSGLSPRFGCVALIVVLNSRVSSHDFAPSDSGLSLSVSDKGENELHSVWRTGGWALHESEA